MLLKSDWCLLLIVSAMFLVGMWLIIVEVPQWRRRQAELYGQSSIFRFLTSITSQYSKHSAVEENPTVENPPPTEERRAAVADGTKNADAA